MLCQEEWITGIRYGTQDRWPENDFFSGPAVFDPISPIIRSEAYQSGLSHAGDEYFMKTKDESPAG